MLCAVITGLGFATAAALTASGPPSQYDLLFMSARSGDSEVYRMAAGDTTWVNLTRHPARDNWPAWSPDGERIVFQSDRSGNLDVWCMRADGSGLTQLTDHPEPDYLPAWSPDGRSIAFTSWRRDSGDTARAPHLYLMRADGTGERRLVAQSLATSAGLQWSPDGRSIVYSRGDGADGADLVLARADGTHERVLTDGARRGLYHGFPTFSPDGKWLAFSTTDSVGTALEVMRVDGSQRRTRLATGKHWYAHWSPDGRWLVHTSEVAGSGGDIDVFATPVAGGETVRLASSPKREQEASWRPARARAKRPASR